MKMRALVTLTMAAATAYGGTVTGTLQGPSGLPVKNGTLNFALQQAGLAVGTGSIVPTTAYCYTSTDGSVVGIPNPLSQPTTSISYGSGSLPAGTYYVAYTFYGSGSQETLASPELEVQLTGTGSLTFSPPASWPGTALGMRIYIATASGMEMAQGNSTGPSGTFVQNSPPLAGAAWPSVNSSVCSIAFNDTIIPYSGYNVSLISASGSAYPGWPQTWQLNGGLSGTVNISNGAPLWNGTVVYPMPLLSQPLNHGLQSISGPLNMSGYNLLNVGRIGIGTTTPSYGIDVEGDYISSGNGYLYQGGSGTPGQCLVSNGTAFVPGSCGSLPTVYYQRMQSNGGLQPQEPFLNFSPPLQAVDNPGSTRTDVSLGTSGVTAGSYTNANITVDALGRVTAATNGTSIPKIQPLVINSGICTTASSAYSSCNFTVNWPSAFADATYSVTCTAQPPTIGVLGGIFTGDKSSTNFTVFLQNGTASGAAATTVPEIDCIGMHP